MEKRFSRFPANKLRIKYFLLSFVFHFVLLSALIIWFLPDFLPVLYRENSECEVYSPIVVKFIGRKVVDDNKVIHIDVPMTPEAVKEYIKEKHKELKNVTIEDLRKQFDILNRKVRPESIDSIIKWMNIKGYEKKDGKQGPIDVNNMTLHSIRKKEFETGTGYVITCVDKNGNTMDFDMPPRKVTPEIEKFYEVYQIIKKNPMLEKLYRGIVMKLLGEIMSETKGKP